MTLIHRLTRTLDPLHGLPQATRQDFACWYRQTKLPQVRQLAFLTMALYLVYALIEQNVAQDQLGLRLLAHGLLVPLAGELKAGVGFTAFLTSRSDTLKGVPVPVVLPLASLQYRKSAVMASFMPGPKGNGNVLFLFGRIAY